jgi:hypothetical protein
MPKKNPDFKDYAYLLDGLKFNVTDTNHFNVNTKIEITCDNNHVYLTSITKIKSLKQDYKNCPHCKKQKKYSDMSNIPFDIFKKYADENNLNIVNVQEFYNKWSDVVKFKCKFDETEYQIKVLSHWIENVKKPFICNICETKKNGFLTKDELQNEIERISIDETIEDIQVSNVVPKFNKIISHALQTKIIDQNRWIIKEYNGSKQKAVVLCNVCGYEKSSYLHDLIINEHKTGCIKCRDKKLYIKFKKNILSHCNINNILPINISKYSKDISKFKCNVCGLTFDKNCKNYSCTDFTLHCPECFKSTKRKAENGLYNFIKTIYEGEIIQNDRTKIKPFELDIYIPGKNIAFEYCGGIWHSSKFNKDKYKHQKKYNMCGNIGIRLITIFEDEWEQKKEICQSRITNLLGMIPNKIYGKECIVKIIDNKTALDFCETNHIQGRGHSYIAYGLFNKDNIVSVMTFSKPSVSKNAKDYEWELNRFCTIKNTIVVGGANKLLSVFRNSYKSQKLVTFCDLRWGSGKVYEIMGFTFNKISPPNYYYIGNYTKWQRKHRFNFTKFRLIEIFKETNSILTEEIIAEKNGLYRIYDCGHKKFTLLCN